MARKIQVEIVGDARSLERAFGRASKAGSTFGKTMRTIGKVGIGGIAAGLVGLGIAMRAGFSELAEAQKVAAQTNAVLRSTGGIANVTAKQVDRLATTISRKTGIDDEAIAAMENVLLTFTAIRNEAGKGNDIFNQATKATLDMATALGMDFQSAAIMVGKALNQMDVTSQGNVRGFMALRRVGVMVTPQMMELAKSFIEAGKPMEAQKLLLKELQTEFGGSAQAFGTTMPGALGKLRNAFDELMAAFATGFLPIILKVANALTKKMADPEFVARVRELGTLVGTKLYNAFVAVGGWFAEHWPQIQEGFRFAGALIGDLVTGVQKLKEAFKAVAPILANLIMWSLVKPLQLSLTIISGILTGLSKLPFVGGKFKGASEAVNAARETVGGIESALAGRGDGSRRPARGQTGRATGKGYLGRSGGGRAAGGPVMPGVAYRVGERGAEMFVPSQAGTIYPMGGGGTIVVPVYLDGREIARAITPHQQRLGKSGASQQRGRHGGQNLAFN